MPVERTTRRAPPANFNRVARLYRWAEYLALGPCLQRTRTYFLPQLTEVRSVVLFGDGDGRFLARLLQQNRGLHATAVDTSSLMLELLRRRCAPLCRESNGSTLCTRLEDALDHQVSNTPDLVVTHFFLDCLSQPEVDRFVHNVASGLKPGGLWLLSDFRVPYGPLRPWARAYIAALYLAFRLLTNLRVRQLPDPQSALVRTGFQKVAEHRSLGGMLYSELWRLPLESNSNDMTESTRKTDEQELEDAIPNPEPIAPSLDGPDPGVFHHEPAGDKPE